MLDGYTLVLLWNKSSETLICLEDAFIAFVFSSLHRDFKNQRWWWDWNPNHYAIRSLVSFVEFLFIFNKLNAILTDSHNASLQSLPRTYISSAVDRLLDLTFHSCCFYLMNLMCWTHFKVFTADTFNTIKAYNSVCIQSCYRWANITTWNPKLMNTVDHYKCSSVLNLKILLFEYITIHKTMLSCLLF